MLPNAIIVPMFLFLSATVGLSGGLQSKKADDSCARGKVSFRKGDYKTAIAEYDEAIRLNPKLAKAYFNRGTAFYLIADRERAIADLSEAIRLDPSYAQGAFLIVASPMNLVRATATKRLRILPKRSASILHLRRLICSVAG